MGRKKDQVSTRVYVRVYDEELLRDMDALIAKKRFGSKSEIVGKCVEIALPLLMDGKAALPKKDENSAVADAIKKQGSMLRDTSVLVNIIFNLVSSMFTERALSIDGVRTNADDFKNGLYERLPAHYQDILNELLKI